MGKSFSCERCDLTASTSVFTFSEDLVLRIVDGVIPEPPPKTFVPPDLNEMQWMEKLHCIDDVHSDLYGLTQKYFDITIKRVQAKLTECNSKNVDASDVIDCYVGNSQCTLRCAEVVDAFLDNIELQRLKKLKETVDLDEANSN